MPSVRPGVVPKPSQPIQPGGGSGLNRPTFPGTGGIQRPGTLPSRPGADGGGIRPDNRPNLPDRPGGDNRPGLPNRPDIDRPSQLPSRPGWNGGGIQRPNLPPSWNGNGSGSILHPGVLPNRPGIGDGFRPNNNFSNIDFNQNNFNFNHFAPNIYNPYRPYGGYTRPYAGGAYRPYGWANCGNHNCWGNYYSARYYSGWHCGYWNNYFPLATGFVASAVPYGWFLPNAASYTYSNPYYVEQPTVVQTVNYSQPLPVETYIPGAPPTDTTTAPAVAQLENPKEAEAAAIFDQARGLFKKNDYTGALSAIEKAIEKLPQDPTLHEFRALCNFAMARYQDAAAGIYAVLAAGPGWNRDTLTALYPDSQTFQAQFTALLKFAADNPKAAYAQFLLGYQYLVLGEKGKAITCFQTASALDPKDELSANLAKSLQQATANP